MVTVADVETKPSRSLSYGGDLRGWIDVAAEEEALEVVKGAHWDLEIGALTEMVALGGKRSRCLLFDDIKDYPSGYRVITNVFPTRSLGARVLGLPGHLGLTETVQAWRAKARSMKAMPTRDVADGPVMENVLRGADIDLYAFPTPRWHEKDGGRYLGTGDNVITRDPETGQINIGTYRMMVQGPDKIGLYISPGHHGRIHRDKYFARGEAMPVAATFGEDPLLFLAGSQGLPINSLEYDWAGAVRGEPVDTIRLPVTGLPVPASAEIAIEGFVYPDRLLEEGPFGEWTGYYASASRPEPYVQVEAIYHRNNPIIVGYGPTRPPGQTQNAAEIVSAGLVWDALEGAGVPDVRAVCALPSAGAGMLVVSITQRYAGHAKQAALVAGQSRGAAYLGRYVVVVDEDIDPTNPDEVLWAIWSRSDPEESLDVIRNCWSTPLDPRIPPERRAAGNFSNSRLIIDATRPFAWRHQFPDVVGTSPELQAQMRQKWGAGFFE